MYFPYLRGKQYELIAIRELLEKELLSEKIIPIIEPIKPNTTLLKTLEAFVERGRKIGFIINPEVGRYAEEFNSLKSTELKNSLLKTINEKFVLKAFIFNKEIPYESLIMYNVEKEDLIVFVMSNDYIDGYKETYNSSHPFFNIIPSDKLRIKRNVKGPIGILSDSFPKKDRNVDYLESVDNDFSDHHLFYNDEGYQGFSDYSIVGSNFVESGFAPMAIAIHIVYFKDKELRIRHFVSESNEDISDPAGKFYEALEKLVEWNKTMMLNTYAINEFEKHYHQGTYRGLGYVKKLSIMHHLELMGNYLDEEDV